MGPSALSNKTYQFDKVFSPAADQGMIFEEVVAPILDEVLAGFNCTIFAYGQTGTGKTYTMSGDIMDTLPLPDAAGIVPRVLHWLFERLCGDGTQEQTENSVKCSFIELYNEELRDLLAPDEGTATKLKIFDEANKNGRTTTLVQGMEESHIKSASKGIQLLRDGSRRRQVAATKCNDLSSRSHTVFTVTVYMKRTSETGEDFVSAGKLNLVDLAGSENIQRSGAENKRAAEAGLINKSLLTLGRVINALVDKSSHIPYRESKLTRLLQDSLGGRTKTCIIATLSPAKSNLEETISTLDYAFRAKNIRNKPQVNQMVSKKTLLREFTAEIEKLKSDLIATRQRNGVYLTTETYEEMTTESESRRILAAEQKDKIETIESNLRNKVQELFSLTNTFHSLKRDTEQTRMMLEGTKSVLEKTEIVLHHTRQHLEEETELREAHERTEERLAAVGEDLLGTLGTTTEHVGRLHEKLRRRSELQGTNRMRWKESRMRVVESTVGVEERIEELRLRQQGSVMALTERMRVYVEDELRELQVSRDMLATKTAAFESSQAEVMAQRTESKDEMDRVLEGIGTLRADVKDKVGEGLNHLSAAAQRISAGIAAELDGFHSQLQDAYASLGKEFKNIFDGLIKRMSEQQEEVQRLRQQIRQANATFVEAGQLSQQQLQEAVQNERQIAASERAEMLAKITDVVNSSATAQEERMAGYLETANKRIKTSEDTYQAAQQAYDSGMNSWSANAQTLTESSVKSRETVKTKLRSDWARAHERTSMLQDTTRTVHDETVRIVEGQMQQMDHQLTALDEIVTRVRTQNEEGHAAHARTLERLAADVQESYHSVGQHFETSYKRVRAVGADMSERATELSHTANKTLAAEGGVRQALSHLRSDVEAAEMMEYTVTGETPAKREYTYPTVLPRTETHESILNRLRGVSSPPDEVERVNQRPSSPVKTLPSKRLLRSPTKPTSTSTGTMKSSPTKPPPSPSKTQVFTDHATTGMDTPPLLTRPASAPTSRPQTASSTHSLRELDANVALSTGFVGAAQAGAGGGNGTVSTGAEGGVESKDPLTCAVVAAAPSMKKRSANLIGDVQVQGDALLGVPTMTKRGVRMTVAGVGLGMGVGEGREKEKEKENVAPGGAGRRLRSRGSD
ncbi:hypothetical protein BAUCODRAFT_35587 [Baudoinia panamericana UAMH 10762]|uniref:Kinesin motor domain-containing protein n=1 Tax=Baudoinia panamericana (strain UAMH 10762) TaxID=717646 RepID=M2LJG3_BAUPA|nr:uncharacterized protein BAUCODRAFT_35587 [Baudoinia panamericana UAMH 10762]EMC94377.1 hypothetical protein BAUCODRAFT_35587 [Baudoinia panamericana UAMH 10762]